MTLWQQDEFLISTDKAMLDFEVIHRFISTSYWAANMPKQTLKNAIDGSLCFGLYHCTEQIGFARVITDGATFGYLADVFVLEQWRGRGLSKRLMSCILSHPSLQGLRRMMLATRDAHGLYRQFGFTAVSEPQVLMQKHVPNLYAQCQEPVT